MDPSPVASSRPASAALPLHMLCLLASEDLRDPVIDRPGLRSRQGCPVHSAYRLRRWVRSIGLSPGRLPDFSGYAIISHGLERLYIYIFCYWPVYPESIYQRYFSMRQSDGSEILGPDDPRNLVIGIIHVSPNDDRQSVITAITTQDKLGRDQIVLDLPAQNKSFKSAVDFEGLHQMASEIEATLVLVAPDKSKIANLARRERFTVYPSLDELARAEFPPLEPDEVEGPEQANGAAAASAQEAAPVEDDEADHARVFPVTPPAVPETPPVPPQEPPAAPPPAPPAPSPEEAAPLSQAQIPTAGLPPVEEDEAPTDPALQAVSGSAPAQDDAQAMQGQPYAAGSNLPVPVGSSALVPSSPQLPVYYEPIEPPRRRSWRGLIITAIILLLLIGLGVFFYRPVLDLFFPPSATVTIVPDSQQLQHTYAMTAVLGVPDPSKNQVDARAL